MMRVVAVLCLLTVVFAEEKQTLSWKDDDGLEVKIIKPISEEKCKVKSQSGDTVDQYYRLTDKDGNEVGSNFGKKP
jgi:FK506-binding protein 9/10